MGRAARNKTDRQWEDLKQLIVDLDPYVRIILTRTRDDAAIRVNVWKDGEKEEGRAISYSDPTGETAVKKPIREDIEQRVDSVADHISAALEKTKGILDIIPADVLERAKRTIPDCLACGKPVEGKILAGYDRACYEAWVRRGRPDRAKFARERSEETRTSGDLRVNAETGT